MKGTLSTTGALEMSSSNLSKRQPLSSNKFLCKVILRSTDIKSKVKPIYRSSFVKIFLPKETVSYNLAFLRNSAKPIPVAIMSCRWIMPRFIPPGRLAYLTMSRYCSNLHIVPMSIRLNDSGNGSNNSYALATLNVLMRYKEYVWSLIRTMKDTYRLKDTYRTYHL